MSHKLFFDGYNKNKRKRAFSLDLSQHTKELQNAAHLINHVGYDTIAYLSKYLISHTSSAATKRLLLKIMLHYMVFNSNLKLGLIPPFHQIKNNDYTRASLIRSQLLFESYLNTKLFSMPIIVSKRHKLDDLRQITAYPLTEIHNITWSQIQDLSLDTCGAIYTIDDYYIIVMNDIGPIISKLAILASITENNDFFIKLLLTTPERIPTFIQCYFQINLEQYNEFCTIPCSTRIIQSHLNQAQEMLNELHLVFKTSAAGVDFARILHSAHGMLSELNSRYHHQHNPQLMYFFVQQLLDAATCMRPLKTNDNIAIITGSEIRKYHQLMQIIVKSIESIFYITHTLTTHHDEKRVKKFLTELCLEEKNRSCSQAHLDYISGNHAGYQPLLRFIRLNNFNLPDIKEQDAIYYEVPIIFKTLFSEFANNLSTHAKKLYVFSTILNNPSSHHDLPPTLDTIALNEENMNLLHIDVTLTFDFVALNHYLASPKIQQLIHDGRLIIYIWSSLHKYAQLGLSSTNGGYVIAVYNASKFQAPFFDDLSSNIHNQQQNQFAAFYLKHTLAYAPHYLKALQHKVLTFMQAIKRIPQQKYDPNDFTIIKYCTHPEWIEKCFVFMEYKIFSQFEEHVKDTFILKLFNYLYPHTVMEARLDGFPFIETVIDSFANVMRITPGYESPSFFQVTLPLMLRKFIVILTELFDECHSEAKINELVCYGQCLFDLDLLTTRLYALTPINDKLLQCTQLSLHYNKQPFLINLLTAEINTVLKETLYVAQLFPEKLLPNVAYTMHKLFLLHLQLKTESVSFMPAILNLLQTTHGQYISSVYTLLLEEDWNDVKEKLYFIELLYPHILQQLQQAHCTKYSNAFLVLCILHYHFTDTFIPESMAILRQIPSGYLQTAFTALNIAENTIHIDSVYHFILALYSEQEIANIFFYGKNIPLENLTLQLQLHLIYERNPYYKAPEINTTSYALDTMPSEPLRIKSLKNKDSFSETEEQAEDLQEPYCIIDVDQNDLEQQDIIEDERLQQESAESLSHFLFMNNY